MEHWEVILDFAEEIDPEEARTLRIYAYPQGGRLLPPPDELAAMLAFIDEVKDKLGQASPLVPTLTERFPEVYPNEEHVRMLQAVAAVLTEANRRGQPFEGDVDT